MHPGHDAPTDETVAFRWQPPSGDPAPHVLHLVIAWFLDEPERKGQVTRIDGKCFLGRGTLPGGDGMDAPLRFFQERPGSSIATPPLTSTALSRSRAE